MYPCTYRDVPALDPIYIVAPYGMIAGVTGLESFNIPFTYMLLPPEFQVATKFHDPGDSTELE